ncbi:hypothetical protein GCM10011348_41930 [Marinobacterium nitratireducens]|uniref:DUF748 domain-containing protein n=1 Tax=Marinobacterium nitratireducens TaxID=518897 RepID=A0A917ZQF6_9GAMM|nr:DUF748 domain-containing protein [Marinobacterium nitratireducens]GGO87834.1 hypothetical protein GCM10011348_41930 [Marinobacterium nitratireducens]
MKAIKWGLGIFLGLLLILQTAPYIVRDQAVIWLHQQGAEDAGLKALKLKWWRGRVEVDRLYARAPGRLPLDIGKLVLDIDLSALFDQRLLVSELSLADVDSGVRLRDDQLWFGPVNVTALQGPAEEPEDSEAGSAEPTAWRFGIDRVRIDRFDWRTELPDQSHHLELTLAELNELYQWRDQERSRLRLQGRLNGAPLDLDTESVPLPADKTSEMQLALQGFPIESVTAAFVPGLSAELSFQLSLSAELIGSDGSVQPKGQIRLDNLSYDSETLKLDNQSLSWDGEIGLELEGLLPHRLNMTGAIAVAPLTLEQPGQLEAKLQQFSWNGDLNLDFASSALPQTLTMKGELALQQPRFAQTSGLDTGLENLSWNGDLALTFDSGALPQALTMTAAVEIAQPAVRQASGLDAGLERFGWNGDIGLEFASGAPASVELDGDLALDGNRVNLPETIDGTLARLNWKGRLALALAEGAPSGLQASGGLGLGDTQLSLPGTGQVGLQQGRWDGDLDLSFGAGAPQDLALSGDLNFGTPRLQLSAQQLQAGLASLGWSGSVKLHLPEAARQLEANGTLQAATLSAQSPQFEASLGELSWQGGTRLVQQSLSAEGNLAASTLAFSQPKRLNASLASLSGSLQLESPDLAAFDAEVPAFAASGLDVKGGQGGYPLATFKALNLESLSLQASQNLDLKALRLEGLRVAQAGKQPLTRVGQIRLSGLQFENGKQARISRLTLSDSSSLIRLDKEGLPVDINVLTAVLDEVSGGGGEARGQGAAASAGAETDSALAWQVDRLELGGENQINFEDASTDPEFTTDMDISRFQVERIGSLNTEPSPFELKARINEFSELDASGAVNLIGGVSDGEWQATLKGVELPFISPYSIRYTGYYIDSGQLSVEAKGSLTDRQLDGTNNIRLNRVAVNRIDAERSAELTQQLSMPLETALAVLQDDDQNIELDVPISGSLDSPDFGYQSVINIIVEKGVKTAAMGFLSNALQPYGALITLAGMAADASRSGSAIELEPIPFEPGSAELGTASDDYLNKIAGLLKERETLRLNLCGQAVLSDRGVLEPELRAEIQQARQSPEEADVQTELKNRLQKLADARAAAVKDYLDDQVDGERLFLCFSRLTLDKPDAEPVVFLGF